MKISPERKRLLKMTEEELDELVHEAKGEEAARINNSGQEAQIEYLMGGYASAPVEEWPEES